MLPPVRARTLVGAFRGLGGGWVATDRTVRGRAMAGRREKFARGAEPVALLTRRIVRVRASALLTWWAPLASSAGALPNVGVLPLGRAASARPGGTRTRRRNPREKP